MGAGAPNPEGTPPVTENKPAETPAPQQDYAALQAQFQQTQEQLKQAVSAIAAMQVERQTPQTPPEPEITPEFQTQAQAFFQKQLAPFLQQLDQRLAQLGGWQSGQQLRHLSQEIDLPDTLENKARDLMQRYANAGRPISYEVAVTQVVGEERIQQMRQEAVNRRAKQQFNTSMLPTFSGAGGLPNLQLNGVQKPKDNDIQGWARFAEQNDMPL